MRANKVTQDYRWVNTIPYVDSENRHHTLAVLECLETKPDKQKPTKYKWVTNFQLNSTNVMTLAQGGRQRWRIENEGFNTQKNGGFRLEHAYSCHESSNKVFYYLMQGLPSGNWGWHTSSSNSSPREVSSGVPSQKASEGSRTSPKQSWKLGGICLSPSRLSTTCRWANSRFASILLG